MGTHSPIFHLDFLISNRSIRVLLSGEETLVCRLQFVSYLKGLLS